MVAFSILLPCTLRKSFTAQPWLFNNQTTLCAMISCWKTIRELLARVSPVIGFFGFRSYDCTEVANITIFTKSNSVSQSHVSSDVRWFSAAAYYNPIVLLKTEKLWSISHSTITPIIEFAVQRIARSSSSHIINSLSQTTLFEIFIFCPKIQLWFPEKIVDFILGKNSWKCCSFGLFSCSQFWFHEKNCQKIFWW